MAKLNTKEHNKRLNDIIKNAVAEIERNGQAATNRENVDGVFIPAEDKERYADLLTLLDILKIEDHEKDSPLVFEDFVVPKKDYKQFMEIANKSTTNINFPQYVYMYGIIPGLNVQTPRHIFFREDVNHYEQYLANFYKQHGIEAQVDENGIREAYPHEKYKWEKGHAIDMGPDFRSPYYKQYRAIALRGVSAAGPAQQQTQTGPQPAPQPAPAPGTTQTQQQRQPQGQNPNPNPQQPQPQVNNGATSDTIDRNVDQNGRRTYTRRPNPGRNRVVRRRSFKDVLRGLLGKIKNVDQSMGRDETWAAIKSTVKRVGIGLAIAAGIIITVYGVGVFVPSLLSGVAHLLPAMMGGGATAAKATGAFWTLMGSVGLIGVNVGLFALAAKKLKKNRDRRRAEEEETEHEHDETQDENLENDNDLDNDLDLGTGGPQQGGPAPAPRPNPGPQPGPAPQPQPAPGPNIDPNSPQGIKNTIKTQISQIPEAQRDQYLTGKLSEINQELKQLNAVYTQLRNNPNKTPADIEKEKKILLQIGKKQIEERMYFEIICTFQQITEEDIRNYGGFVR